jgi:hypothetical protein
MPSYPIMFLDCGKKLCLVLGLAAAVGACSASPARQDKENVQKARSLLAEWAMIAELHGQGRLTETYYAGMRDEAEQALTTLSATAPQSGSAAGREIGEIARLDGEPSAASLRARAATAQVVEERLEAR